MKRIITVCAAILMTVNVFAQVPEKISYQAVVREGSNNLVKFTAVGMQISVLEGSASGTTVYVETQTPTSNANGLVSIEIGTGNVLSGDFTSIDWANGLYFIKTETDPTGGTSYTITGTSQLLSVPYSLHAKTAETVTGEISETDPIFTNSEAVNLTENDVTNLGNLSGLNTGDQDISGIATNQQAIQDTASQIRGDIPDTNSFLTAETDPTFTGSEAANITKTDITNLGNLSGVNTGDQDISGIATNRQAIQDTASQIRADIPDVSGFLTNETDPSVPIGTQIGEMQYWNGTAWVTIAATENEGATLQMIGGVPTWVGGTPPTVPDAPTIGKVTAVDGQASVPFTAPADDGGSTITSYTATSNPANITGTISQTGSGTITVTGLTNGTDYTFTVTATNSVGTSAASTASNSVTPAPPSIGDYYQGGVIFYLDGNGGGLVCAIEDQSTSTDWGCYGSAISGSNGWSIGTGSQNTIDIEASCAMAGTAANICANLSLNGYNDWFLPSGAELDEMYNNNATIDSTATSNGGSSFASAYYWSSSVSGNDDITADAQYLNSGAWNNFDRDSQLRVRAVRAF